MKIHFITHESFESPAAIELWAKTKGHEISYSNLHLGENLPEFDDIDFLVVMGGPQSPATTTKECAHFNSHAEQALIKKLIDADKIVLGVCLGAQLIGEALGAKFEHSPHKEIGVFNITLTEEGKQDPIFSQFAETTFPVAHWHGDMPGLTAEAKLLAYSEGCPRQIVRYTPKVYGFQCHFEFTPDAIHNMLANCAHEVATEGRYIQNAKALLDNDYTEINNKLFFFLDELEKTFVSRNVCQ